MSDALKAQVCPKCGEAALVKMDGCLTCTACGESKMQLDWQPVTPDSPPWDGQPVLVWRKKQGLWISSRLKAWPGRGADFYLGSRERPPTHWMPLPEPPA